MRTFYNICLGLSLGILVGVCGGGLKSLYNHRIYSEKKILQNKKLVNKVAMLLKYVTFVLLALGLVWCVFFLILGIMVPSQVEYANNMAELIVCLLTVISILFAFVEFLKH